MSLPTLLTIDAWEKSGRLFSTGAEVSHRLGNPRVSCLLEYVDGLFKGTFTLPI